VHPRAGRAHPDLRLGHLQRSVLRSLTRRRAPLLLAHGVRQRREGPPASPPEARGDDMTEVRSGLEGVVAFASQIAEPDRDGGALRYRGVDIEELAGRVPFEQVWGLLVDDALAPGLEPVAPVDLPVRSGNTR